VGDSISPGNGGTCCRPLGRRGSVGTRKLSGPRAPGLSNVTQMVETPGDFLRQQRTQKLRYSAPIFPWHGRGQGFESPILHQPSPLASAGKPAGKGIPFSFGAGSRQLHAFRSALPAVALARRTVASPFGFPILGAFPLRLTSSSSRLGTLPSFAQALRRACPP